MRLRATTVGELSGKVDEAIEAERAVLLDVNVQRLEVGRGVDDTNITSLYEVVGDNDMLLIRGDLDVVRSNGRLVLIRIVKALDVAQIGNVESSDVVSGGKSDCNGLLVPQKLTRIVCDLQYANFPSAVISE